MRDSGAAGLETLVLGIDGACRAVLDPLFDTGATPTIERLVESGVTGPLESQIPPWTASAWPSLFTGMNPGKHGVFGFLAFDGYDWDVVDGSHVRERSLWEILDRHGLTSVVVNVPTTSPPRPFDGALVPGYLAPDEPTCHPEGLFEDVRDAVGEYCVYPSHTGEEGVPRSQQLAELRRLSTMRGEAFRYLLDRFDPDFGFLQFQQTDSVFHDFGGDMDAAQQVYEAVDAEIARTLDHADPETVFVVSDHGLGPYGGHEFRVNEHLRTAGQVSTTRGGDGMPSWSVIRNGRLAGDGTESQGLGERVISGLSRVGLTSQRIGSALARVGLDEFVLRHVPQSYVRAGTERVDFAASRAFMRSRVELGVRLNVAGREPDGVVHPEEYDSVREEVMATLRAVETPDGKPVFERVAPREAIFEGPHLEEAADVIVVPREFDEFLSAQLGRGPFGPPSEPWNHKLDGIVAVNGREAPNRAGFEGASLFDVAPTVLSTFGVPLDDRMDGRVLPGFENPGTSEYPAFDPAAATAGTDDTVEARLADLGYIE